MAARGPCSLCGRRGWSHQHLSNEGLAIQNLCDICIATRTLQELLEAAQNGNGEWVKRKGKARRRWQDLIYEEFPPEEGQE